jgi:Ice-binding-like/Putative Ig domain
LTDAARFLLVRNDGDKELRQSEFNAHSYVGYLTYLGERAAHTSCDQISDGDSMNAQTASAAQFRHVVLSADEAYSGTSSRGHHNFVEIGALLDPKRRRMLHAAFPYTPDRDTIRTRWSRAIYSKYSSGLASLCAALLLVVSSPVAAQISLGTAQNFGVLSGSTTTNTGATTVNGNVGVSPGSAVTGFPPGVVVGGAIHSNDAVAMQAQNDLTTAYNNIASTPCTVDLTGQNLGGLTLTPGVYCFSSSAQLTGALTLDALGNPNALFLFKIGSTLTTASGSSVTLINGGSSCGKVFWQVGSSAAIGTGTSFAGDILALTSITMTTGANSSGRLLARNGAVTLDTNNINTCGVSICPIITANPATLPNGSVGTPYNQTVSGSGGTAPYTFSVSSGALPGGLILNAATGAITGTPTTAGTFTFSITATDVNGCPGTRAYTITISSAGCPAITLSPTTLPPGLVPTPYSQSVTASGGTAPYTYTIASGALPTGLLLSPATGLISGAPAVGGIFTFTIQATDASGCSGARLYTLAIVSAPAPPPLVTPVPTLDFLALVILALLLAAAGAFSANRFRK